MEWYNDNKTSLRANTEFGKDIIPGMENGFVITLMML